MGLWLKSFLIIGGVAGGANSRCKAGRLDKSRIIMFERENTFLFANAGCLII